MLQFLVLNLNHDFVHLLTFYKSRDEAVIQSERVLFIKAKLCFIDRISYCFADLGLDPDLCACLDDYSQNNKRKAKTEFKRLKKAMKRGQES